MLGYAIIQLPDMTLSMCKFIKAWMKKKSLTSFNNSNGEEATLEEVHGFDKNGRKVQLRHQKNDESDTNIDRECQCNELRKEMLLVIASLRNETDMKLYNIYESLKEDLIKSFVNKDSK